MNLIRTDNDYKKTIEGVGGGGGGGGGIPGGGIGIGRGAEYINYGLGGDYKARENGRNRQRSDRLEYDKSGGVEGFFPPSGEGRDSTRNDASPFRPILAVKIVGVLALVTVRAWLWNLF